MKKKFIFMLTMVNILILDTGTFNKINASIEKSIKIDEIKNASWEEISKNSKSAIVQIFSYIKEPHYFARYKNPDDHGTRGTGFIISKNGEILTNFHVVENAAKIFIQHPELSKEKFEIEFVGGCPNQDIALLKIKSEKDRKKIVKLLNRNELPFLKLGDSDKLVEAQKIMTLGYPLGQENIKSSLGILSGRESTQIGECIQTTTPINPGNSGGPFLDKSGKVIGLCVLKQVGYEVEGIGYLIPINNAIKLLPHLRNFKIIRNPHWGISWQSLSSDTRKYLKIPFENGIYIINICKESLGEKFGLKKGDIIYTINDKPIDKYGYINQKISLNDYLNTLEIGSQIILSVYRNGEYLNFQSTVIPYNSLKIKKYYSGYENLPEFEVIGGLVITELNLNQIELGSNFFFQYIFSSTEDLNLEWFAKYKKKENLLNSKLIISYIIPGSKISNERCLKELLPGINIPEDFIIKKVNDLKVSTIEEFRHAVIQTDSFLRIETKGGNIIAISIEELIQEDFILSQQENFKPSELIQVLTQKKV